MIRSYTVYKYVMISHIIKKLIFNFEGYLNRISLLMWRRGNTHCASAVIYLDRSFTALLSTWYHTNTFIVINQSPRNTFIFSHQLPILNVGQLLQKTLFYDVDVLIQTPTKKSQGRHTIRLHLFVSRKTSQRYCYDESATIFKSWNFFFDYVYYDIPQSN